VQELHPVGHVSVIHPYPLGTLTLPVGAGLIKVLQVKQFPLVELQVRH